MSGAPGDVTGGDTDDVLAAFRGALPPELVETDLSGFDSAGAAVWSVALLSGPGGNGVGYGSSRAAARASAFGELVEWTRSHTVLSRARCRRATFAELSASGQDVQDPRTLCLPAGSAWTPQTPLEWLAATRLRDGEPVWVPVDLLASRPVDRPHHRPHHRPDHRRGEASPRLVTPITNGLGAGLDADRALAHALLELVQRDGNGLVFRSLDRGVVVDLEGLHDPAALDVLARLRRAGVEPLVKLASTELGVANVYAVADGAGDGAGEGAGDGHSDGHGVGGADDEPVVVTAIGEAAHPDREAAVRKALLELCSSRARKAFAHGSLARVRAVAGDAYLDGYLAALPEGALEAEEPRALAATVDWLGRSRGGLVELLRPSVLSQRSRVPLSELPAAPALREGESARDLRAVVVDHLAAAGLDVLVLDLSGDGVHAVKALVPGLEVETMSYGRIGERGVGRALELGLPFVAVGADPGGWSPVLLTEEATERLGGPAWLDRPAVDAVVGDLYPLYREPGRHTARLAMGER